MEELEQSLYAKREKIYPRAVQGWFATRRAVAVTTLLGLFYGVAWLRLDQQQLLLFDLPNRKFHVFGVVFFPQDFLYLSWLMIIAAVSLFFFTALAGRLWCGYACPQTAWTELFLWVERRIEGNRSKQMKRDRSPWSPSKVLTKSAKHTVWIVLSMWTGFTFVGYFTPIAELASRASHFDLSGWETFWVFFYGFATYANAGWMREQVCIYMCPYARFQSAMFDANTLVISYDEKRGEQRGSRKRGLPPAQLGLGDCVDCTLCVQVCPTGIDIRDGLQYQCIACASCVDVCNQVMDKMGYEKGLIRYTTENAVAGKPSKVMRPRILIYAAGLMLLSLGLAFSLLTRPLLELEVNRDRKALYRETETGLIENVYTVQVLNKSARTLTLELSLHDHTQFALRAEHTAFELGSGERLSMPVHVEVARDDLSARSTALSFRLADVDAKLDAVEEMTRFLGPNEAYQ